MAEEDRRGGRQSDQIDVATTLTLHVRHLSCPLAGQVALVIPLLPSRGVREAVEAGMTVTAAHLAFRVSRRCYYR